MILYSIIIPVYKRAHLCECLDSVLTAVAQMEKGSVEILCIEDGSPDGSGKILDAYAVRNIGVLRVIHQQNRGTGATRNHGMDEARGQWVLFVDDDDLVRETWLQTVARIAQMHPDADLIGFEKTAFYTEIPVWGEGDDQAYDVDIASQICNALALRTLWNFAFRRDVHGILRFAECEGGGCDDLLFVCEAFVRSRCCFLVGRHEYAYRCWGGQEMRVKPTPRKWLDLIDCYERMYCALDTSGKKIGDSWLLRGSQWIEEFPREIRRQNLADPGWKQVWKRWLKSIAMAGELKIFPFGQRFAMRQVLAHPNALTVRCVCVFPSWLRRKHLLQHLDWLFVLLVSGLAFAVTEFFCAGFIRPMGTDMLHRYAPMAEAFANGEWQFAFHPRFGVLFPTLTGSLVWLTGVPGPCACQAVALLFWALAVIPLWSLGKRLFGRLAAAVIVFAYLVNADMVRYAAQGWRDDCRILPLLMTALGLVRLFNCEDGRRVPVDALLVALATVLMITLRVDCFLVATVFTGVFGLVALRRRRWCAMSFVVVGWILATFVQCWMVHAFEGWWLPCPQFIPIVAKLLGGFHGL